MSFVLVKPIKPTKLNETAMREALRHAEERVGRVLLKDFEETVQNWEHRVVFKLHTSVKKGAYSVSLTITIEDEIWGYVNDGTKPHEIWPGIYTGKSNKTVLAFASAFSPKTKPGSTKSGAGSKGKVDTFRPYVNHPGTEARNFTGQISKRRTKWFKDQMIQTLKEAARASGHQR